MTYTFWHDFEEIIPYELQIKLDVRLSNVEKIVNDFFETVITSSEDKKFKFYLAGSCIKADCFRDIDFIFPDEKDMETLNDLLNKKYFAYKNNSYTYNYADDIFQLVFRKKFENASLDYLVDNFDFDSTKIAFDCEVDLKTKKIKILQSDIREEFIHYIQTKQNNLNKVNINPFVSLQRAMHFLKRGDDVPYSVFLDICSRIADMKIENKDNKELYFDRLQGDEDKLKDIKKAISQYVDEKKDDNE